MPITVLVRSATSGGSGLTFDGTQRIVIGRGASCDVRLPDATVSHRHASLRSQGADFVLFDEGSMNGTFVGGVRVAARTSRIVRSGDLIRVGRVWLEVRLDHSRITRDVAAVTRELALALVSQAIARAGGDSTTRVQVVEGRDQGATLLLALEDRDYSIGRAADCELPLADGDASRVHVQLRRRGGVVTVRDLGAKNGTWLADTRLPACGEAVWRSTQMMRLGRTVLSLVEPVDEMLAQIEGRPDEILAPDESIVPPPSSASAANDPSTARPRLEEVTIVEEGRGGSTLGPGPPARGAQRVRTTWSVTDVVVMSAALGLLLLSIAGLAWLLRG
jgi:pSer/pThr/pTyr-binding forkhead associated (FHA) protein